jgi:hypothetical protein
MGKPLDYNRLSAIFFLVVGILFSLYARSVEIGTWHQPGPGFLPFWAGLTLAIMSAFLLLKSYGRKARTAHPPFFSERNSWKRVLATFLALFAYVLFLTPLGFALTTFFFLVFLLRFVFPQAWGRILIVATLGSAIARVLFIDFLETQLPKGVLGF